MAKFAKSAAAADPLKPYAPVADQAVTDTPQADAAVTEVQDPVADAGLAQAGAGGTEQSPQVAEPPAPAIPTGRSFRVRVRALQPSRWRAGRQFGPEPVEIAAEDLTEAQIAALMGDPLLSVDVL